MGDPGYDFFAVPTPGSPDPALSSTEPAPMTVNRFGSTAPAAHAVRGGQFGAPTLPPPGAPGPTPLAHAPAAVNQFGTPIDAPPAPTGPYAAPGVAAVPTARPGMVSTWGPSEAPSRASARPSRAKPSNVTAAGVIAIVLGSLMLGATVLALLAYLSVRSELDALATSAGSAGLGGLSAAMAGAMVIGIVVMLAFSSLYLVSGIATVQGQRWGAWILLVVCLLDVLYGLYEIARGTGTSFGSLASLAISATVVALLALGESRRWLQQN